MKEDKDMGLKEGLISKAKITQKEPRGEGEGQRPVCKEETVSSDRGKFKIK